MTAMTKEKENYGGAIQEITLLDQDGRTGQAVRTGSPLTVRFHAQIIEEILFDPTFRLSFVRAEDGGVLYVRSMGEDGWDISWLPRGDYTVEWQTPRLSLPKGRYKVDIEVAVAPNGHYQKLFSVAALTDLEVEEGSLD